MSIYKGWMDAAAEIESPYPEDLFTPLTGDDFAAIREHLQDCPVNYAMERMHASWARHWARVLRDEAAQRVRSRA